MMSFKLYMLSIMKDEEKGLIPSILKVVLLILSWFYLCGIKIVDLGYTSGIRKIHKTGIPVISVGNISLGGTGKTPFTVFLAKYLISKDKKPAVLTRGYGKDESRMLKDELPEVSIFVGQDRVKSADMAVSSGKNMLILDDGFQHRRLARDLNILLIDSISFLGNRSIFPRGILREPVSSIKRADILVLTKSDMVNKVESEDLKKSLESIVPGKPVIMARHKPVSLLDTSGAKCPLSGLNGMEICLVSGIVDPEYFAVLTQRLGARIIARLDFPDHHQFNQKDIDSILVVSEERLVDKIVITKKDFVKINDLDISGIKDKLFILDIEIDILEGKEELIAGLNSISAC